jgi:hypothetical protein
MINIPSIPGSPLHLGCQSVTPPGSAPSLGGDDRQERGNRTDQRGQAGQLLLPQRPSLPAAQTALLTALRSSPHWRMGFFLLIIPQPPWQLVRPEPSCDILPSSFFRWQPPHTSHLLPWRRTRIGAVPLRLRGCAGRQTWNS